MLTDRAVPIELDGEQGSIEPFSILDEVADRCRVAYIGEMDHFVAEKLPVRLLVCRYLASRGWRLFGEEWPELQHQRPFTSGVLANDRQPTTALAADQAAVVLVPAGRGTTANPWLPPPGRLEPAAGTFDAELLARVGRPCLVPVDTDHLPRVVTAMHNQVLHCRFSDQVDAIVFVPEVSPLVGR